MQIRSRFKELLLPAFTQKLQPKSKTRILMEKIKLYIKESYNELLTKVTWPSWDNLMETTIVVLVGLAIFTLMVFVMDSISNFVMDNIYKLV